MFTLASEHCSFFNEAFELPFVFSACAVVATPFKHGNDNDQMLGKNVCNDCCDTGSLRLHVHPRVRALLSLSSRRDLFGHRPDTTVRLATEHCLGRPEVSCTRSASSRLHYY